MTLYEPLDKAGHFRFTTDPLVLTYNDLIYELYTEEYHEIIETFTVVRVNPEPTSFNSVHFYQSVVLIKDKTECDEPYILFNYDFFSEQCELISYYEDEDIATPRFSFRRELLSNVVKAISKSIKKVEFRLIIN